MIGGVRRGFRHGQLLEWRASVVAGGRPSRRPGCRAPSRSPQPAPCWPRPWRQPPTPLL